MKLSAIGLGQCGCNIADEFYSVNEYARDIFGRHIEILTDAFAMNTDKTDLRTLRHVPDDKGHRLLVGTMDTFGHGVGKMNAEAAAIIKSSNLMVTNTIMKSRKFHECEAVIVIASGGGGTGSGTIGWTIKEIKERADKPVYAIIVLPFAFEEKGDASYAVTNTATCINTVAKYADAIFLVDNERFRKAGGSVSQNLREINRDIALNFYDLCCAGEEHQQKYVGSKVIDTGDIRQSLSGISSVGRGQVDLPTFRWNREDSLREGVREQNAVAGALKLAIGNLGVDVELKDARKILVLLSAPKDSISLASIEEVSNYLQSKAPEAIIRVGDYPRRNTEISITLVVSELTRIPRMERLFLQANVMLQRQHEIQADTEIAMRRVHELMNKVPNLD